MGRRVGKAAERSRRRKVQRAAARPAGPPSSAASATPQLSSPAPPPIVARPARPIPGNVIGISRLTERAAAEYHYVLRDLRNIGVLVGLMAVVMAAAVVAFNLAGIGPH